MYSKFLLVSFSFLSVHILSFSQEDYRTQYFKKQDSLRLELKKVKNDITIDNLFIEDLYLKDLVTKVGDSVNVLIPFDSHSNDCGTPDCYITEVSFSLPFTSTLILPDSLNILYYNTGCHQDSVTSYPSMFQVINKETEIIVYYNWLHKASLILFTNEGKKKSGGSAFFIENVERDLLTPQVIYHLYENYSEEDDDSLYPYSSTILRRGYEYFFID